MILSLKSYNFLHQKLNENKYYFSGWPRGPSISKFLKLKQKPILDFHTQQKKTVKLPD